MRKVIVILYWLTLIAFLGTMGLWEQPFNGPIWILIGSPFGVLGVGITKWGWRARDARKSANSPDCPKDLELGFGGGGCGGLIGSASGEIKDQSSPCETHDYVITGTPITGVWAYCNSCRLRTPTYPWQSGLWATEMFAKAKREGTLYREKG